MGKIKEIVNGRLEENDFVYYQNQVTKEIKSYSVVGNYDNVAPQTMITLEDEHLDKITIPCREILFNIDHLTQTISHKDAILKEYAEIKTKINNHEGDFNALCFDFNGYNLEYNELFDINTECGVWTIHYNDGDYYISKIFEMYDGGDALDMFDIDKVFGDDLEYNPFDRLHWKGKEIAIEQGFNWVEFAKDRMTTAFPNEDIDNIEYYISEYWNNLEDTKDNIENYLEWKNEYYCGK